MGMPEPSRLSHEHTRSQDLTALMDHLRFLLRVSLTQSRLPLLQPTGNDLVAETAHLELGMVARHPLKTRGWTRMRT